MTGNGDGNGTLYELRSASRLFRRGDTTIAAVDSVDLTIPAGGFIALEGPSGSGKTTLLQLLGALDRPTNGQVLFDGRDLAALPDRDLAELRLRAFGFVFQQFNLIPTLTALENVENVEAASLRPGSRAASSASGRWRCSPRSGSRSAPSTCRPQLSGGEQQRVAIARALGQGAARDPRRRADRQPRHEDRLRRHRAAHGPRRRATARPSSSPRTTPSSRPARRGESRCATGNLWETPHLPSRRPVL